MKICRRLSFLIILFYSTLPSYSQTLHSRFDSIARSIKGKVGVYARLIETGDTATLNGYDRFPMQSVYKFPIAMAILARIDGKQLGLEHTAHVLKTDLLPRGISPLRDKYPNGNIDVSILELLHLNICESDGSACDVLLKVLGGTTQADNYVRTLGIRDLHIATTEQEQQVDDEQVQYKNWCTPSAMTLLFTVFQTQNILSEKSKRLLTTLLADSGPGAKRLKSQLPAGTVVAHKTGTSFTANGLTRATNDAGIIILPNGKHLVISVFISDSPASQEERELTIARIGKAAWDYWTAKN